MDRPTIPKILAIPKIATVDITRPFASVDSEEKRALRIERSRPCAVGVSIGISNSHALLLGNKERKMREYEEREVLRSDIRPRTPRSSHVFCRIYLDVVVSIARLVRHDDIVASLRTEHNRRFQVPIFVYTTHQLVPES